MQHAFVIQTPDDGEAAAFRMDFANAAAGTRKEPKFSTKCPRRDISITGDASYFDVVLPLMTGPHGKTCERL